MAQNAVRIAVVSALVLSAGAAIGAIGWRSGLMQAQPLLVSMIIGLAAAVIVIVHSRSGQARHRQFAASVGSQTDYMMIGAAGVGTRHDHIRVIATTTASQIGKLFEQAIAAGTISAKALFDRTYVPIPNTNPQKHTSRFDGFTDRVLPVLQEATLLATSQLAYAGAVDSNGYFPTHNRKFSQPPTGNYEKDLANNRTERIFTGRTGSRCDSSTEQFLLQTYKRDTGEVMHGLSAPIHVNGRHRGGFRIGYRSANA